MKRFSIVLAAGLALVAQPQAVEAQWDVTSFVDICVPGSLQPCASVMVKTQWNPVDDVTLVEMWVRNQQGSTAYDADYSGGSFLTQVGLIAPTIGTVSNFAVRLEGTVGSSQPGLDPNALWGTANGGLGGQVAFKAATAQGKQGAIRGCDQPVGNTSDYFSTCAGAGETGYVVFSFTADGPLNGDPEVAVKFASIADPNDPAGDVSLVCRTGDGCVSVTPEPSTWILLATGLAGVFGMGWIRRRREDAA